MQSLNIASQRASIRPIRVEVKDKAAPFELSDGWLTPLALLRRAETRASDLL